MGELLGLNMRNGLSIGSVMSQTNCVMEFLALGIQESITRTNIKTNRAEDIKSTKLNKNVWLTRSILLSAQTRPESYRSKSPRLPPRLS